MRSLARLTALLAAAAREMEQIDVMPLEHLASVSCQLAALQNLIAARYIRHLPVVIDEAHARDGDRLLTVAQAAARLACSKDWLYRHRLPFAVRNGRQLRFSADGLERYIRSRAGRESASLPPGAER